MELLTKEGYRLDGRKADELRKIEIIHKIINNTTYLTYRQGLTHINCTPFSIEKRYNYKIKPNIIFSQIANKENRKMNHKMYEIENIIINTFETIIIGEKQLGINIEIMQDDGALISCILNSISLFLCLHSIPIKNMLITTHIVKLREGIICDPIYVEDGKDALILGLYMNTDSIGYLTVNGKLKEADIDKLYVKAQTKNKELYNFFESYLKTV
ncbi:Exosome complex component RRP41 [Binucleata daphniae]